MERLAKLILESGRDGLQRGKPAFLHLRKQQHLGVQQTKAATDKQNWTSPASTRRQHVGGSNRFNNKLTESFHGSN